MAVVQASEGGRGARGTRPLERVPSPRAAPPGQGGLHHRQPGDQQGGDLHGASWEHYRLGEIVGEATAGTNGNVNSFRLPGSYFVGWTGMQVVKHDGSRHHGVGIRPTVPVTRTLKGVTQGRDELLEKAIEIVGN